MLSLKCQQCFLPYPSPIKRGGEEGKNKRKQAEEGSQCGRKRWEEEASILWGRSVLRCNKEEKRFTITRTTSPSQRPKATDKSWKIDRHSRLTPRSETDGERPFRTSGHHSCVVSGPSSPRCLQQCPCPYVHLSSS